MENTNRPFFGTELKINVHIDPVDGMRMDDYFFKCDFFMFKNRMVTVGKEEMIRVDEDNYVALVDSSKTGSGALKMKVTAFIPDADMPDGERQEVVMVDTGITVGG